MRLVLPLITACAAGGAKTATPPPSIATPATPPAPIAAAASKPASTPFGRYTVVAPAGYAVEAREIEIGFRRDGILIIALDGAELEMPPPEKCEAQLAAFVTGTVTGLARAETRVNVVSSKRFANGCSLTGTTSGTPGALVEAAILDFGIAGPAVAFLVHARSDDGSSTVFDELLTSIAKK